MGSCAVKSSNTLIDSADSDVSQVVRILINSSYGAVKCPVCSRPVGSEDPEIHLIMCLTRPKLHYNEEKLLKSKGIECVICLEELRENEIIARLPCLCVYHKTCIDQWFSVNRTCPQHPGSGNIDTKVPNSSHHQQ